MGIEARRIRRNEGEMLRAVRLCALRDSPHAFGARLEDEEKKPISEYCEIAERHASSDQTTTFLALNDDKPVGQVGVFFEQRTNRAFICAMWVDPDYRRKAIGKGLFDQASKWLHHRGAEQIHAWVADSNSAAIPFYTGLGFFPLDTKQALPSNPEVLETLYANDS